MRMITLTKDQVTLVDDEDYEWLNQSKWLAKKDNNGGYYAVRNIRENGKQRFQYMHKIILGIDGTDILGDHKNGNGLDNQRYNLRKSTSSENSRNRIINCNNTSGYKGVTTGKFGIFRVSIKFENKSIYLGEFKNLHQAAKMYDFWARDLHKEFANCNFPGIVVAKG